MAAPKYDGTMAEEGMYYAKNEAGYPALLREIPRAPVGIYIKGDAAAMKEPGIAIVGTRKATPEGKRIARTFGRRLAEAGFAIISGLAFGIDAAAHEGMLEAKGKGIAVLAGGLHDIYPRSHGRLAEAIIRGGGAIVSEYPPGESALPGRFIERNRIISGLARGTVVIEAPEFSGSLATARFAFEANRDVFVVPGNIANPNFRGSHALIRQGAELVTSPEDILAAYGIAREEGKPQHEQGASPEETLILKALSAIGGPADVDKLVAVTKLEPHIAMQALSVLFIKHLVRETGSGYTMN